MRHSMLIKAGLRDEPGCCEGVELLFVTVRVIKQDS
jgi:hypothetical protein